MRQRAESQHGGPEMVTAAEIACLAYCPEQWRMQYGLGLKPGNQASTDAGTRHHELKAAAERMAGSSVTLGRFLAILAEVALLLLLWWWL